MEQWEKELRKKLNKEIPEGAYQIGGYGDGFVLWTGKQGLIQWEIELRKACESFLLENQPLKKNHKK